MSRLRPPFLPTFLTLLSIAFAVVLVARIRTYTGHAGGRVGEGNDVSSTISGPGATSRHSPSVGDVANEPSSTTIAVASTKHGAVSTATPATNTPRAQLYRQLLNAPPPSTATNAAASAPQPPTHTVAAAKPPEKPQSAIAKIIQPIKNLFSGSASVSTPAPPAQQSSKPNPDTPPKQVDKDPNTDTTPPQVLGVQFDPTAVHDGDVASIIVVAQDDLSGIRGISGTVTSPTGKALQGFACQREAPESNRYIGRVTIPKDAEEGMWHINFLNVSDFASNSVTLAFQQAPVLQGAQLQVTSSRSDKTPPTVTAAWIDRKAMRAGERNTLFVQAQDDKSGVALVSGVFLSPAKHARIGVPCQPGDGDLWTCSFSVPACLDCGDWQLEQIQVQDKASNMASIKSDVVNGVTVNIQGDSCDSTPPTASLLIMETNQVISTPSGTSITVTVSVSDDMCGVASVSAQVVGPVAGSSAFFAFASAGGSNWVGHMPIPPMAGHGPWKINWLQVMDKGNNLQVYFPDSPLLRNAVVNVR